MHRQLLPHQSDAVNSIMNAINSQNISSMVISMPVGTGSTIVALEVFHRLYCNDKNKRTLFLLDYVQLCEQLRDNLLKESGDDVFRKQSVEIMTYQQFSETIDEKALSIFTGRYSYSQPLFHAVNRTEPCWKIALLSDKGSPLDF